MSRETEYVNVTCPKNLSRSSSDIFIRSAINMVTLAPPSLLVMCKPHCSIEYNAQNAWHSFNMKLAGAHLQVVAAAEAAKQGWESAR